MKSQNFTVGLTNVHPLVNSPVPGAYAVCGHYPCVPQVATVKLECNDTTNPQQPVRYVIVQFHTNDTVRFCEVEVYTADGNNNNNNNNNNLRLIRLRQSAQPYLDHTT